MVKHRVFLAGGFTMRPQIEVKEVPAGTKAAL
jgi:hypothetical protein